MYLALVLGNGPATKPGPTPVAATASTTWTASAPPLTWCCAPWCVSSCLPYWCIPLLCLVLELCAGRLPGYPLGGKNYVHVRDVAVAAINALSQGGVGESYIVGHENLSYQEAFGLMAGVMGVAAPRWPVLPPLAKFYGVLCAGKTLLTGRLAQVNPAMVAVANDGHYFTPQKARRELSLPQTSITQAVVEAFDWFTTHGYVQ
jgi:dihydroflavonol-4-reductase